MLSVTTVLQATPQASLGSPLSAGDQARLQAQSELQHARADVERMRIDLAIAEARAGIAGRLGRPTIDVARHPLGESRREQGMLFGGLLSVLLAAVVILRPITRALGKRLEGGRRHEVAGDDGSVARLVRIEQAVDAMSVEIERISEGQRFTTKLLAHRAQLDEAVVREPVKR